MYRTRICVGGCCHSRSEFIAVHVGCDLSAVVGFRKSTILNPMGKNLHAGFLPVADMIHCVRYDAL